MEAILLMGASGTRSKVDLWGRLIKGQGSEKVKSARNAPDLSGLYSGPLQLCRQRGIFRGLSWMRARICWESGEPFGGLRELSYGSARDGFLPWDSEDAACQLPTRGCCRERFDDIGCPSDCSSESGWGDAMGFSHDGCQEDLLLSQTRLGRPNSLRASCVEQRPEEEGPPYQGQFHVGR